MTKQWMSRVFLLSAIAAGLVLWPQSCTAASPKVRQAAVAGEFYPADAKQLSSLVDGLLARASAPATREPVVALVAPHAGYVYSGAVAAQAYALLKGRKVERVVVIAPSHFESFSFAAVYNGDAYATPLGIIPVDKAFAARLAGMSPEIKLSSQGHAPSQERGEHALEVQLPFLQRVLGEFKLVPIVMGEQSYGASRALGVALAKAITGTDTLIVASSDLSHFHTYDQAASMDRKTLKAVEDWDYLSLSRNFATRTWEACGGGPVVAAMIAAERLGANQARVLQYANTADVTGDRSRVVGYGAVAFVRAAQAAEKAAAFSLEPTDRATLLQIAKKSVEMAVKEGKWYEPAPPSAESLLQERGAFVTLRKKGELRGCIGYVTAYKPLYLTVRDVAAFAALRDERFPPVTPAELGQLDYELSVLSPFRRVLDIKQIQVGQHGLLVRKGTYEGLLLPQVPTEQGWDRATFLEQTAAKAGLPPSAWRDQDADIFLFSALVFDEHPLGVPATSPKPRVPKPR